MQVVPLSGPPGYEYHSTGPWFVSQIDHDGRAQTWMQYTLPSAVFRFWLAETTPARRVLVDACGICVMATDICASHPRMVGTRETAEETMVMVRNSSSMEHEVEVLSMVEALRQMDGRAL